MKRAVSALSKRNKKIRPRTWRDGSEISVVDAPMAWVAGLVLIAKAE